ncbi:gamma-glutamyl-gamma-aminobutyrate hydrolase family protein, partial [bacterium]|nr:gamma-glutamyl-gamma-aminobutyrate hydrolase family protein [bacterium]
MRPVIAITPEPVFVKKEDGRGGFCGVAYSQAIERAGGLPWVLPLTDTPAVLRALFDRCDGLLLTGGGDFGPGRYGRRLTAPERATLTAVDDVRDRQELYLVRQAWDRHLALLGVCRGLQVMNLALGGSLYPDIAIGRPDANRHEGHNPEKLSHTICWIRGTRLARVLGRGCGRVNSTHHQAINTLAPGFVVAATASDGIIE